ncbi:MULTISPECIES: hypothetical protein [unclassified Salipiger]|uniref:hypothetical protein n=1 Tax=unclassified Salipiger TaxID=2640570 RepID=UPI0013BB395D|nr:MULTISPECIES: hypothetical protein [unclassified Salipiger]NDV52556.1 hypothetical protein [Salipiger sp. PrR003]NDW32725.1 hypothetical protein [Salipiger sp. PrR007]
MQFVPALASDGFKNCDRPHWLLIRDSALFAVREGAVVILILWFSTDFYSPPSKMRHPIVRRVAYLQSAGGENCGTKSLALNLY